ncbi:MAG: acyl-CoA reductase [Flavobacteriaceae bacterium]
MQLQQRINAFSKLGYFLKDIASENSPYFQHLIRSQNHNRWFTIENICFALKNWSEVLSEENIITWLKTYTFSEKAPKTIAVIMAGNIPLVGFHDFIAVLVSGNKVLAKLSSNDKILLPFLSEKLIEMEPEFKNYIEFTENKLERFDAVIATGSNNTALYFEHYFGKYPNIIRKNRNSVAVLTGTETVSQLEGLSEDIFSYFGLGCRNVSKLYVPKGYNFELFFKSMFSQKEVIHHDKYMNNYDYNKAVYLMGGVNLLDNEFLLLKEDPALSSPISVVFYEYYTNFENLKNSLTQNRETIQCIVSDSGIEGEVHFGKSQSPQLWEYADGVDTLKFLATL